MKQAVSLYIAVLVSCVAGVGFLGTQMMLLVTYGALSLMAFLISITFLWLWQVRATPLALGMSLSWAGSGLTIGWWWYLHASGVVLLAVDISAIFAALALLVSGAVLHFAAIQNSFGLKGISFMLPVVIAVLASLVAIELI